MRKEFKKSFFSYQSAEPPAGLFDRIILAIQREKESRRTRRLLLGFLSLLFISLIVTPFSWTILANQINTSGTSYFISAAISDFDTFLLLWQDFGLAIIESLPLAGILFFVASLGISVFTLRLFLYRKKLLIGYLMHNFA